MSDRFSAIDELLAWLRENNGYVHDSLSFAADARSEAHCDNVFAVSTQALGPGAALVTVPHPLLLNCVTACMSPHSWIAQSGHAVALCAGIRQLLASTASGPAGPGAGASRNPLRLGAVDTSAAADLGDTGAQFVLTYLFLIRDRQFGPKSFWNAYYQALPSQCLTPLTWPDELLALVQGTNLHSLVLQTRAALQAQYDVLFPGLYQFVPRDMLPTDLFTFDQFVWAYELFWSRCLAVPVAAVAVNSDLPQQQQQQQQPGSGQDTTVLQLLQSLGITQKPVVGALVPVADLLNHDPRASVAFVSAFTDGGCVDLNGVRNPESTSGTSALLQSTIGQSTGLFSLCLEGNIAAGAQACISYGPRNNERLLLNYGFCLEDNIYAESLVQLRIDEPMRRNVLLTTGLLPSSLQFTLTPDEPIPPGLLHASRCGVLSDLEVYSHDPSSPVKPVAASQFVSFVDGFCHEPVKNSRGLVRRPAAMGRPAKGLFSLANETRALSQVCQLFQQRVQQLDSLFPADQCQQALDQFFQRDKSAVVSGHDRCRVAALVYRREQRVLLGLALDRARALRAQFHGAGPLQSSCALDTVRLSLFGHIPSNVNPACQARLSQLVSRKLTAFPLRGAMHSFASSANTTSVVGSSAGLIALEDVLPDEPVLRIPLDQLLTLDRVAASPCLLFEPLGVGDSSVTVVSSPEHATQTVLNGLLDAGFDMEDVYTLWVMCAGELLVHGNFSSPALALHWDLWWLNPLLAYPGPAVAWPAVLADPVPASNYGSSAAGPFSTGRAMPSPAAGAGGRVPGNEDEEEAMDPRFAGFSADVTGGEPIAAGIPDQQFGCAPARAVALDFADGRAEALDHGQALLSTFVALAQACGPDVAPCASLVRLLDPTRSGDCLLRRFAWASAVVQDRFFDGDASLGPVLIPVPVIPAPVPGTACDFRVNGPTLEWSCPGGLKRGSVVSRDPGSCSNADLLLRVGCCLRRLGSDALTVSLDGASADADESGVTSNDVGRLKQAVLAGCGIGMTHFLTPDVPLPARLVAACRVFAADDNDLRTCNEYLQYQLRQQQQEPSPSSSSSVAAFTALSAGCEWRKLALIRQLLDALAQESAVPITINGELFNASATENEGHVAARTASADSLLVAVGVRPQTASASSQDLATAVQVSFECRRALAACRCALRGTLHVARQQLEDLAEDLESRVGLPDDMMGASSMNAADLQQQTLQQESWFDEINSVLFKRRKN